MRPRILRAFARNRQHRDEDCRRFGRVDAIAAPRQPIQLCLVGPNYFMGKKAKSRVTPEQDGGPERGESLPPISGPSGLP